MRDRDWNNFDALLDQLLDLEGDDAARRIAVLDAEQPGVGDRLRAALSAANDPRDRFERPAVESWASLWVGDEEHSDEAPAAAEGRRFGRWRTAELLGRGGMGEVYAAVRADGEFEQRAALKILRAGGDLPEHRARFLRERRILARFEHPCIARLLDGDFDEEGRPYLVLERVDGRPITAWCDERRAAIDERIGLFLDVLAAVDAAHRSLVVHRDLKPSNILVTDDGGVKLLDFDVAKLLEAEGADLTATRGPLTPQYAAPEQIVGEPVTTATDIYALGLVLCELLAGALPYRIRSDSALELERRIVRGEPAPPSALARAAGPEVAARRGTRPERLLRELAGDLDAIVLRALAKDPERRYRSAAGLAADLEAHRAGRPVSARPDSLAYRARRFVGRHRVGVAATGALALLLVTTVVALLGALGQSRARLAEAERASAIQEFVLDLFRQADPGESLGRPVTVREVLDRGARQAASDLAAQPETRAAVLETLGSLYTRLGLYDQAGALLDEARQLSESSYPEGDPRRAAALLALGELRYWRDDYPGALEVQERAIALLRGAGKGDRERLAQALFDAGSTLRLLDRYEEAETLERQALAIDRELHGDDSLEAAVDLTGLALTLHRAGRDEEALPLAERVAAMRRSRLPADDPALADALETQGLILAALGRPADAEEPLREVLAIRRRVYGEEHPQVLEAINSLATGLEAEAGFGEAIELRRRAVEIARRVLPPGNASLGTQINNLAVVCFRQADFACAADGFREALAIWIPVYGADHPSVASARNNLGFALLRLGEPRAARVELEQALASRRTSAGERSAPVAQTLRILGLTHLALGDRRRAREELAHAVALAREVYPERHPRLAEALISSAELALAEGRGDDALRDLAEATAIRQERLGAENPLTVEAREALAAARLRISQR